MGVHVWDIGAKLWQSSGPASVVSQSVWGVKAVWLGQCPRPDNAPLGGRCPGKQWTMASY